MFIRKELPWIINQNQVTITFNSNDGTEVSSITQDYNTKITKPNDPTKTGYIFDGWYSDSDLTTTYEFTTMPKENITLHAKWLESSSEGLSYTLLEDNTYSVSGYSGSNSNVLIPSVYNGYLVTSINDFAFQGATSVTKIIIPDSVITIGDMAFYGVTSLMSINVDINNDIFSSIDGVLFNKNQTTIIAYPTGKNESTYTIPNDVTSIGDRAFYNCSSLTNITIPSSVTSIGDSAFTDCVSLMNITIPNSVTSIGDSAFYNCNSLISITIPSGVTSIGDYAFSNCSSLINITISSSVTSIGNLAFTRCSRLIIFAEASSKPSSWSGILGISNSRVYWGINSTNFIEIDGMQYVIKDGNAIVSRYVSDATVVSIPETITINDNIYNVTSIGNFAFSYCTSVTSITIPNSVTSIGEEAFSYCNSLTNITIPNSVTSIGNFAFSYCNSLTSITIPNSVTNIGDNVFTDCISLNNITIPSSITSIGDRAFYNCSSLTNITIPSSVTSIGEEALFTYNYLIIYAEASSKPSSWINRVYVNQIYWGINSTNFIEIDGLQYVIKDGNAIVSRYVSDGTTILIPETITINDNIYNVASIGDRVFYNCSSLTSITIPSSVTSIGNRAFGDTESLISIKVDIENDMYRSIDGVLFNKNPKTIIAYPTGKNESTYTIPNNVTSIGDNAFYNCNSLTNMTIPSSVTSIGDKAFYNCSSLTSITIPSSVTTIGYWAFWTHSNLTIYAEASRQPNDWSSSWNDSDSRVYWYSETQPVNKGYYWHYVNDVATKW